MYFHLLQICNVKTILVFEVFWKISGVGYYIHKKCILYRQVVFLIFGKRSFKQGAHILQYILLFSYQKPPSPAVCLLLLACTILTNGEGFPFLFVIISMLTQ